MEWLNVERSKARNAFRLAAGCRLEGAKPFIRMKTASDKVPTQNRAAREDKPGGPVLPLSANGGRKEDYTVTGYNYL